MTDTTTAPAATHAESAGLSVALGVGSVLAVLGSLGYISLNSIDSPREAYMHPVGIVSCAVATAGIVVLSLAVVRWRTRLPDWAILVSAAGLALTAGGAWFFASGVVAIADHTDEALFEEIGTSAWMFALWLPKAVLCLVGFAALAISGWRTGAVPRAAAASFGAAAVASLMPVHPPGVLLASLALFIVSRSRPEIRT